MKRIICILIVIVSLVLFAPAAYATQPAETSYNGKELAIFPMHDDFHLSQLWYTEGDSHSNQNAIDVMPLSPEGGYDAGYYNLENSRVLYAPFTGRIVDTEDSWGCVFFESENEVIYADGSVGKMVVGFGHDNKSSSYEKNVLIRQGQPLCRAGTAGGSDYHSHILVIRGAWSDWDGGKGGSGNVYPTDAFFMDTSVSNDWTSRPNDYYHYNQVNWKILQDFDPEHPVIDGDVEAAFLCFFDGSEGCNLTFYASDNIGITNCYVDIWEYGQTVNQAKRLNGEYYEGEVSVLLDPREFNKYKGPYYIKAYVEDAAGNCTSAECAPIDFYRCIADERYIATYNVVTPNLEFYSYPKLEINGKSTKKGSFSKGTKISSIGIDLDSYNNADTVKMLQLEDGNWVVYHPDLLEHYSWTTALRDQLLRLKGKVIAIFADYGIREADQIGSITVHAATYMEEAPPYIVPGLEINEANFPDSIFRAYVSENCDTDNDGFLGDAEIAAVTSISVDGTDPSAKGKEENKGEVEYGIAGITTLKGIEHFNALKYLSCDFNQLEELDVNRCTALRSISCNYNKLKHLNISGCTELRNLRCYYNKLTALDVSNCIRLEELWCDYNELQELDVRNCPYLYWLYCFSNQLTKLEISGCTSLAMLECDNNKISKLDASGCTSLGTLWCKNNQLTELNVRDCSSLADLECWDNQLSKLSVNGCAALKSFKFKGNPLVELDASFCGSLGKLDVSDITSLQKLYCSGSNLTQLNVEGCTGLKELDCSENQLSELDVSGFSALQGIFCGDNCLTKLNVHGCIALKDLYCDVNKLTELDVGGLTELQTVYGSYNQLSRLNIQGCKSLNMLYCMSNQLKELNANGLAMLETLICNNNKLTNLSVSGCTSLQVLFCSDNQLASLSLEDCTVIGLLECYSNQLTRLDISKCRSLVIAANIEESVLEDGIITYSFGNYFLRYDKDVLLITGTLFFPSKLTTIESEAFANGGFSSVYIPPSVETIATDAFGKRTELLVFGLSGSCAEIFADDLGYTFVAVP